MSLEGSRLLVSDQGVGIHVYDVSDPSAPVERLTVPLGDNDISIYDATDPAAPVLLSRIE